MNFDELYNLVIEENVVEESAKDTLKMLALAAFFGLMTRGVTYPILKDRLDNKLKQAEQKQIIAAQDYADAQVEKIIQDKPQIVKQLNTKPDINKAIEIYQSSSEQKKQENKPLKDKPLEVDNFESFLADTMKYIEPKENSNGKIRNEIYADNKGYPTIGIGHLVIPADSKNGIFKPEEVKLDKKGNIIKVKITDARAREIFRIDLIKKYNSIKSEFPNFDKYPSSLKIAMMDGYFRGDLSGSPKTKNYIKQAMSFYLKGEKEKAIDFLDAAANEYIDNDEYELSKKMKQGVYRRMNNNAELIKKSLDNKIDQNLFDKNVYDIL
jgi:hypothetical protein